MNINEYLDAYESYRQTVLSFEKILEERYHQEKEKVAEKSEVVSVGVIGIVDYEELKREYERRKRILTKATKRLQRAINNISNVKLSNYLVCKYLYNMKNEDIATNFTYCERQIYRIAARAKKALYEELLIEMPSAKRWKKGKVLRPVQKQSRYRKFGPRARKRRRKKR